MSTEAPRRRSPITFPEFRKGKLPPNFGKTYPPEVMSPAEVVRLLDTCDPRSASGVRDRALIALLWRSGLRISEALALYPRDLHVSTGIIRVRRGRNSKARTVAMDEWGWAQARAWLDRREALGLTDAMPLFCVHSNVPSRGRAIRSAYVREMLKRRASKAGITRRVHPHGFRHTFASELAQEGVSMRHIQLLLGHASLETTAVYLAGLAPIETIDAVRSRPAPLNA